MTELEKKLEALGVLDKFEANLQKTSDLLQAISEPLEPAEKTFAEFIKMLYEISPEDALDGAFKWDTSPEGPAFWQVVSVLAELDIDVLSPELLNFCYAKYVSLN